jgi:hypothetical protein
MKYLPAILMLIGGALLIVPQGTDGVASVSVLQKAYQMDKDAKVANLRTVAAMTGASVEERAKAWSELDREAYGKAFDEPANAVSQAILDNKELQLAEEWSR